MHGFQSGFGPTEIYLLVQSCGKFLMYCPIHKLMQFKHLPQMLQMCNFGTLLADNLSSVSVGA